MERERPHVEPSRNHADSISTKYPHRALPHYYRCVKCGVRLGRGYRLDDLCDRCWAELKDAMLDIQRIASAEFIEDSL